MAAKWIHNYSQAKAAFEIVIHYGEDTYPLHAQAKKEYGVIVRTEPLRLIGRALTEFIYLFQKPFMEFIKTQDIARPRYL
jgi:hypothetical protein